jgi:predicted regulator of Ras-like GTPase activity (Roadblock/LC7/MglB family)
MNKTTMMFIQKNLNECNQGSGVYGAVLASPDGLILSSSGAFGTDEAAACAASLMVDAANDLHLIERSAPKEIMIWGDDHLLMIQRLKDGSLLMIGSTDLSSQVQLRARSHHTAEQLNIALNMLG